MNVHLTPELEQMVQEKVKSGRYNSASEVVREALRLMEQRDEVVELQKDEMRRKIQEGWDALQRGEKLDGEKFFAELEAKELLRREKAAAKSA
jgi:antitoxin ParD1/3/4